MVTKTQTTVVPDVTIVTSGTANKTPSPKVFIFPKPKPNTISQCKKIFPILENNKNIFTTYIIEYKVDRSFGNIPQKTGQNRKIDGCRDGLNPSPEMMALDI